MHSYDPVVCARRWISQCYPVDQPSELWPVQDGLLLNKLLRPRCPGGFRVIMAVSGLNLDLDQLNLVQDELFHELEAELAPELERLTAFNQSLNAKKSETTRGRW